MKKETTDCAVMYESRFKALNMEHIELARGFLITVWSEQAPKNISLWLDNILTPACSISELQKFKKTLKSFSRSKKYQSIELEICGCIIISRSCLSNLPLLRLDIIYAREINFSIDFEKEELFTTFLTPEECGYLAKSLKNKLKNLSN